MESHIVKPNGWVIPDESIAIHGITPEIADESGSSLYETIESFMSDLLMPNGCDTMVAHNLNFDYNVLMNALIWDLGNPPKEYFTLNRFCTMKLSTNMCRLPSRYGFKSPKLSELSEFVMKKKPDESRLHGSMYDTEVLTEIVQNCAELRKQMGLPVASVTNQSNGHQTNPSKTLSIRLS